MLNTLKIKDLKFQLMLKYIVLLIKNYWEIPSNVSWRLENYHILLYHVEENWLQQLDNKSLISFGVQYRCICLLVVCILTRPTGCPNTAQLVKIYGDTTHQNT